ncbi:MAG: transcription-repair coupling factor [Eubacteriales bacterium]|nr:transcription-repair coupling factor [Eubacteriales bacterium]
MEQELELQLAAEKRANFLRAAERDPSFVALRSAITDYFFAAKSERRLRINLQGMGESLKPYLIAALLELLPDLKILYIESDELNFRRDERDFEALLGVAPAVFRPRELEFREVDATSRTTEIERLACLHQMQSGAARLVLAPVTALSQRLASRAKLDARYEISVNQRLDQAELRERLVALGFEALPHCEGLSQFSQRGDIIDFVPLAMDAEVDYGVRISFFDDEIDRIDRFDLDTQRSLERLESVEILSQRELELSAADYQRLAEHLEEAGAEARRRIIRQGGKLESARKIESLYLRDAERCRTAERFPALDRYLDFIFGESALSLVDYAAEHGYLIIVDELLRCQERLDRQAAQAYEDMTILIEHQDAPNEIFDANWRPDAVLRGLDSKPALLSLAALPQSGNGLTAAKEIQIYAREAEHRHGLELQMLREFQEREARGESSYILCSDPDLRERLRALIFENCPGLKDPFLDFELSHGFEYPAAKLYVLSREEVFASRRNRRKRRSKTAQTGAPIALFTELKPDELLVHDDFGIGIYRGLTQLEHHGAVRDYLQIEYAGGDKIYLPMDALDQIQKYIGTGDNSKVKLSRLGGQDWEKAKSRARDSIKVLATDLVELYAKRRQLKGHAFPPKTPFEADFAARFDYEETNDQLQALDEICADMESDRVMDRLLCGDVGFGKTEVAFRAMFKCACDSKQAVLLAPTTVLSQQHYETLLERLGDLPLRVALLNRFVAAADRKKILRAVQRGDVDILIGTHRVLSKDVKFADLGLLVVDEEQRFGVDHKESLKAKYPEVDVLTLTATPIPRTLHMSLSGIRDISVLEEPPENRRPVRTFVMDYDEGIVADAILREINRGGQVFYLFNNVEKMPAEQAKLERLLPDARIVMGHGKMSSSEIEAVMETFLKGEADILLCSTIIESGIDIPNVNTLIVCHSDRFGLSQLYQIKGRVGRSTRQAYAYFTYEREKVLNAEAQKRLIALREYTELGSGFKIALKDLEVRGAGNLLGGEQHGQMAAIGYELYCRMLDEEIEAAKWASVAEENEDFVSVRKLERAEDFQAASAASSSQTSGISFSAKAKSEAVDKSGPRFRDAHTSRRARSLETLIDLKVDAFIRADYVPDESARVDLYRRIVRIETYADYLDLQDEFLDRFGDPPPAISQLLDVAYVRARASRLGCVRICRQKSSLCLEMSKDLSLGMGEVTALMAGPYRANLRLDLGQHPALYLLDVPAKNEAALELLRKLFYEGEREAEKMKGEASS